VIFNLVEVEVALTSVQNIQNSTEKRILPAQQQQLGRIVRTECTYVLYTVNATDWVDRAVAVCCRIKSCAVSSAQSLGYSEGLSV